MNTTIVSSDDVTEFIEGSSVLVVIVSYKSGELVKDTVDSLAVELEEQPGLRVVIVDNTCGDDAKVLEQASNERNWKNWVKIVTSSRNGGFSYGNNLAIRPALKADNPPEYIWLLNPDTQVRPGASSALVSFLEGNKEVGIAGSCLINEDGNEWRYAFRFPSIVSDIEQALQFGPFTRLVKNRVVAQEMGETPSKVDWLPGASMMIRLEVFKSAGIFDEDYFLYYEETDFCLNAMLAGWSSWYVPSSKVLHIAGQSTGATGTSGIAKRLPEYMFDSRCHYFTKNHGYLYATIADIAKICALVCNKVIKLLLREPNKHRPYLLRDSLKNFTVIKYFKRLFTS